MAVEVLPLIILRAYDRGRDLIRGGCLSPPPPQLVDFWDPTSDPGVDLSSAGRTDLTLGPAGVGGIGAASFSFTVKLRMANSAEASGSCLHIWSWSSFVSPLSVTAL